MRSSSFLLRRGSCNTTPLLSMRKSLVIATRGSQLALWQAEHVKSLLQSLDAELAVDLAIIKTKGDIIQDVPLAKVGGKGLFVKEIEEALLEGRADLAVHSIKDVPMEEYDREMIKVQTSGQAVGQVNGLSVTWHGDFEFGLPHRISCTVGVGHEGIIDLEREAELGGPIHTKAMAVLEGMAAGSVGQGGCCRADPAVAGA